MPISPALNSFSASTTIRSADVNSNFTNLRDTLNTYAVLTDVARTISVTHTFSASQTFSSGIAVTGNSTITGTLGGLTGLTVASGGAAITGNSTVTGTLNVTSSLTQNGTAVVLGSGTSGTVPKFTAASTLGDSPITIAGNFVTNASQPCLRASAASAGAVADGVSHTFSWNSPSLNVGTMWAVGQPTRLTAPANGGGTYLFIATLKIPGNGQTAANAYTVTFSGSGGGAGDRSFVIGQSSTATEYTHVTWTNVVQLNAADYVEVALLNNSGAAMTAGATCAVSVVKLW